MFARFGMPGKAYVTHVVGMKKPVVLENLPYH